MKIVLGCQKNDELQNLCKNFFGSDNVEVLNRNAMLSLDEITIIISAVELTIATISFLYTVLSDWKHEQKSDSLNNENNKVDNNYTNVASRRVIVTKEGDINLEGYSVDEVERLLKLLEGQQ